MADKVASSSSSKEKSKDTSDCVDDPVFSTSRDCFVCTLTTSMAVVSALGKRSTGKDASQSKSSDETTNVNECSRPAQTTFLFVLSPLQDKSSEGVLHRFYPSLGHPRGSTLREFYSTFPFSDKSLRFVLLM